MTIRDVAKYAGVSIATVSRVLNGSDKVSAAVNASVESAMIALNYQKPVPKKKKATKLFAVIVRNMTNPFFAQLLDVLEEEAYKHGRSILLFNSRNNLQLEKMFLKECENHHVDGVFLVPRSLKEQHIQTLQHAPFPVVLLTVTTPSLLSVGADHQRGGELVAQHFIKEGHRRIGYIGTSNLQSDRFIGFQTTLAQHGIMLRSDHILTAYDEHSLGHYIAQHIDQTAQPLTAVFCSDDITASHIFTLRGPSASTVEIMGFDDTFIARTLGFSSVHQPIRDIALHGFNLMLRQLNQEPIDEKDKRLEPTLVLRDTPSHTIPVRHAEILKE